MNSQNIQTYCVFCIAGQEGKVIEALNNHGYFAFSPTVMKWKPGKNGIRKAATRLLPGYVFFDSQKEPTWREISANSSVIRVLQYNDGVRALRDKDTEFITWLKQYDGVIDISQAIQVGSKIQFIGGPLKGMDGRITKVNKNRKQVQVALGEENSLIRTIWCGIEYVQPEEGE